MLATASRAPTGALRVQIQTGCIVCGRDHPHGLRIRYGLAEEGVILSTVLDEAMSKAVAAAECEALTGELRVRFRHYVAPGEKLHG